MYIVYLMSVSVTASLTRRDKLMLECGAIPSSEHVGFTFLTGKLIAKDAGPGSKVVRATLLG